MFDVPKDCQQVVLVTPLKEGSFQASMSLFVKKKNDWQSLGEPVLVVIGKNGVSSEKKEGDLKSPLGAFPLLSIFGTGSVDCQLPFIKVTPSLEAVDDPQSVYYNTIVDSSKVDKKDWKSSEKMWDYGDVYQLGIVVGHNMDPVVPGEGSCIFVHVWRSFNEGTAGCVAMDYRELEKMVLWLDGAAKPYVVLKSGLDRMD